jgi:hypothetical protein
MKAPSEFLRDDDFIQEGASPAAGVLILACTVGDDYDSPKNRVVLLRGDSWLDFGYSGGVLLSADAATDGTAYVLSDRGAVIQFDWRAPSNQVELKATRQLLLNDLADSLGPLRRIRRLGNEVFTCGTGGQVYRLRGGKFDALPRLSIPGEDVMVEDLSGTGFNDLLAVTTDGYAAYFDGSSWHLLDLPSNAGLNRICRLPDGRYAIAGYNSTVLLGQRDQWQRVAPLVESRNYYGVASWGSDVFVASLGGIDVFDGTELRPVPIPTQPKLELSTLTTGPDGVWSLSGHTIGLVSAAGWLDHSYVK